MLADRIAEIQQALVEAGLDGWLFTCFQHNDPISLDLLGLGGDHLVTRRCYYLVPNRGEPHKLVHRLEPAMLDHLPGGRSEYLTWREHADALGRLVARSGDAPRLAVQYSPSAAVPTVSRLDLGTAELLREAGAELTSSADLVQRFAATWSDEQLAGHRQTCELLHRFAREAFRRVGETLAGGGEIDEYAVQRFLLERFAEHGLWTESPPIVGVNAHSADPHYQPGAERTTAIRRGDFLLIDLWAKLERPGSVYADICWCGVCAPAPTDHQQEVFGIVARARDAALDLVRRRFPAEPVMGYEVDDAARQVIVEAGYGERFIHRTGHSLHTSDHGPGANMDNLETHDTRRLVPRTGFSIEPGIYLPGDFGVRSEINVALTEGGAEVTGGEPQRELLRLLA
ncbi:MAG TPA: Xaa-Pro peptidase family protein [Thermoanaerobaculia bacterium]|nr:Xaa-Pro peptidase family protein [Thermoanaerobaculia bacterium]